MSEYSHDKKQFLLIILVGLSIITSLIGVLLAQRFLAVNLGLPPNEAANRAVSILGTEPGEERRHRPAAGHKQSKVPLITRTGLADKIKSHRGKPVVVNFWASWCGPCRSETPDLVEAARRYEKGRAAFIGINVSDSDDPAARFIEQFKVRYPNFSDQTGKVSGQYRVTALPTTVIVGPNGNIVRRYVGQIDAGKLKHDLNRLISNSSSSSLSIVALHKEVEMKP